MTTTRPSYVPSYVPHYCEVQFNERSGLCGDSPVTGGYIPVNNVEVAMLDTPRHRIKWHCLWHGGTRTVGTLEEIFKD